MTAKLKAQRNPVLHTAQKHVATNYIVQTLNAARHEYNQGNPNYTPAGTPTITKCTARARYGATHTGCRGQLGNAGLCTHFMHHFDPERFCDDNSHRSLTPIPFNDNGLCTRATDHRMRQSAPAVANTGPKALIQWAAIADYHGVPKDSGGGHVADCLRRRGYEIKNIVGIGVAAIRRVDAYRKRQP